MTTSDTVSARARLDSVLSPLFVVLWSSAFVAGAVGLRGAPALLLTFARFAVAGVLLAGLACALHRRWPRGRQLGHIAVSGLLMQAVQFGALYAAMGLGLPGGVVALVQGLNPAVIALLAGPVLGERASGRQCWGYGVGAAGVLLAVSDQWSHSPLGVLCAVVGLVGLGAGTVYQKRFVRDMDVLSGTAVQFAASTPVLGVAMLVFGQLSVTDWGTFGVALAWIVLVNSVGTFVLLNVMLRRGAASRVGTLFFLTPSVTAAMCWVALGRTLSPLELAGLALGGLGVLLAAGRRAGGAEGRLSAAAHRALHAAHLRAWRQRPLGHRRCA
ncbi:MAG TPA: DMT family transporter [Pseudonocardia sp.]|uniref:DMT family transporter n=1 Tax=Pseudonocardia sp. TaxID=60912 RepID=UPI002F3E5131